MISDDSGTIAALHASPSSPPPNRVSAAFPQSLAHAAIPVLVNGHSLSALIDSCSSDSFINELSAHNLKLHINPSSRNIAMANTSMKACVTGYCVVNITVDGRNYKDFRFNVMKDLCSDIILGYDFQNMHKHLIFELSGSKSDLVIENNTTPCALSVATVDEPSLFANLLPNCKPIATKPRRFGLQDREFI